MVPVVNYPAVIVAAILSMVIGSLWYGPLFGKQWMKMMGWSKAQMSGTPDQKEMSKLYGIQAVASIVMAFVLAHSLEFASTYMGVSGVSVGLQTGFWNWLGYIAPTTLGTVLWEGKSWRLWLLNNAHYLVSLLSMGVLLAVWK